ncbi:MULTISPECIES: nucleoside monophosphate kinase [unclassified Geodermatophilus]
MTASRRHALDHTREGAVDATAGARSTRCGKGTHGARLAAETGVDHVSSGDVLRAEIAGRTPVGRELAAHVARGDLVADDLLFRLMVRMVEAVVAASGGYIADGFPRTLTQAERVPGDRDRPRAAPAGGRLDLGAGRGATTAVLDHHSDHHCALFGVVRHRSPSFRMPVDLRTWTSADGPEPPADGWGQGVDRSPRPGRTPSG